MFIGFLSYSLKALIKIFEVVIELVEVEVLRSCLYYINHGKVGNYISYLLFKCLLHNADNVMNTVLRNIEEKVLITYGLLLTFDDLCGQL